MQESPGQGSASHQGSSREVTSQGNPDIRIESQDRRRHVADEDNKGRLKRPRESSPPRNPPQGRPSVICSAQQAGGAPPRALASAASERSTSAARASTERSTGAASISPERSTSTVSPEDDMDAELSSLSALMHSQVLLSLLSHH